MTDGIPKPNKFARKLAAKAAKRLISKALESAAGVVRAAADRAAETTQEAAERTAHKRLPIQRSVDVAVPIRVAWSEWEALEFIPEGVDTIIDIERDGATLVGRTAGMRGHEWAAEVIDERERESFAWQSHVGSDCAGLITFHELSERLTRIELNLDVVPAGVGETVQLATHRADRKAELDLRRFKARLELISPDLYEPEQEPEGEPEPEPSDAAADAEDDGPEADAPDDFDEEGEPEADAPDDFDEDGEPEADAPDDFVEDGEPEADAPDDFDEYDEYDEDTDEPADEEPAEEYEQELASQ